MCKAKRTIISLKELCHRTQCKHLMNDDALLKHPFQKQMLAYNAFRAEMALVSEVAKSANLSDLLRKERELT